MDLFDLLSVWMRYSFFRLGYSIVATVGFSNPITLIFITTYNMLSVSYLLLITALGYLLWRRKSWMLSFAISLAWTFVGLLFFGACWQRYGLTSAVVAIFTHGWLELSAVFYWIRSLRKACLNCNLSFENKWSSWRDWMSSVKTPAKLFHVITSDVKKARGLTNAVLKALWPQGLKRDFLLVFLLIFASALIETYVTPIVMLSLSS